MVNMRYTLLQLVQRVLESMVSDEVNTIGETPESTAVLNIIEENYYDIISDQDLPNQESVFHLTPSNDNTKPCLMYLPDVAVDIEWLKYNDNTTDDPNFYDVQFMPFPDFVYLIDNLNPDNGDVSSSTIALSTGNFTFKYKTNMMPSYYTTYDDKVILFDSYDKTKDTTLSAVKTMAYGMQVPTFTKTDAWVPNLNPRQFQLLLQNSKAQAFVEIKQVQNPNAEKKSRRNTILSQREKHAIDRRSGSETYRQYGRR